MVILLVFNFIAKNKYAEDEKLRSYFRWGLFAKLFAGICFALIYDLYYGRGGDTFYYFWNASRLGNVLFRDAGDFFKLFFGLVNKSNVYNLNPGIGYCAIRYLPDTAVFATHRFLSVFTILGLKNYYLTIICLNAVLFILNWKVFLFFKELMPQRINMVAIGILFIPSVLFWSSGLTKDAFTFTFSTLFITYFYRIFFKRRLGFFLIIKLLFCSYIIVELKPYILYALIVSGFVWLGFSYIHRVKSRVLRVFIFPILMFIFGFVGMLALTSTMSMVGGAYQDVDSMLKKASVAQQDLKQEYYKGVSFDIGDYKPTLQGSLSVAPSAIIAGLYRPFLWEAKSIVMVMSGFENLILILLTIFAFFKAGPRFVINQIFNEPFIGFCFMFSLLIAFGIGISTSNFGALVRFKIPLIPFFFMGWLIIYSNYKIEKRKHNCL